MGTTAQPVEQSLIGTGHVYYLRPA